ncbi:nucleotidyl transferase AbiEii/AbiGii toxin family protein [Hymenobacter antarcticus]|uniref:Nucleotidyltransferase n=1 Tax=Hymenobacter antarcticus TaxID=486270 RepID=A0ABP7QMT3_9BACT
MSATYPISPDELHPVGMAAAMVALQRGFDYFGIDFYIIGAVARDIWLSQIHEEPIQRMTKDLDLAVLVNDETQYEALLVWLTEKESFVRTGHSAFCLLYQPPSDVNSVTVDLMPFGAIADEAGDVYFSGRGMERISTVGYEAVLSGAATMTTPAGQQWQVVTLPGLVTLKLIAWQDRPEKRGKDALDVRSLLQRYFDLEQDAIYASHHDLFDENDTADPGLFLQLVATRVLGRQLQVLLKSEPIRTRLLNLLRAELQVGDQSQLARAMSQPQYRDEPAVPSLENSLALLGALLTGLLDGVGEG